MYTYSLTLLSPLFYRTRQDAGAAGSTITDPRNGDLALSYAINRSLGLEEFKFGYASHRPDYTELGRLPFVPSVAAPYPLDGKERPASGMDLLHPSGRSSGRRSTTSPPTSRARATRTCGPSSYRPTHR